MIRSSMWSTMPTPWRRPMAAARSSSSTSPRRSPSIETGRPASKPTVTVSGSSGASSGRVTSWKRLGGRRGLQVLDLQPLRGASPEVVVDRVGSGLGAALDRNPVLAGVGDLLLAAHPPLAHRSDHLELGVEGRDGRLEAHLVVALAGAAVGDRVATGPPRRLDRQPRDQRAAQGGEQRVAAPVEARWQGSPAVRSPRRTPRGRRSRRCPRRRDRGPWPSTTS